MHNMNCRFIRLNFCHIRIFRKKYLFVFLGKNIYFASEHKTVTKLIKYSFCIF